MLRGSDAIAAEPEERIAEPEVRNHLPRAKSQRRTMRVKSVVCAILREPRPPGEDGGYEKKGCTLSAATSE